MALNISKEIAALKRMGDQKVDVAKRRQIRMP